MYLADYHTHSDSSPDGKESIARLAEAAIAKGLQEICITDHVDTVCWGSYAPRWDYDWEKSLGELEEARRLYGNRLTIRLGAELGEANLAFDRAEHLLSHAPKLDFVIGSVHMAGKKFGNFDLYYVEKNSETYYHALIDSYLEDVLSLARWGKFSVLGHLTLPLRYINENLGERMTFDSHMEQVEEIFRTMIPKGLGIECNTNRGKAPGAEGGLTVLQHRQGVVGLHQHRAADQLPVPHHDPQGAGHRMQHQPGQHPPAGRQDPAAVPGAGRRGHHPGFRRPFLRHGGLRHPPAAAAPRTVFPPAVAR